MSQITIFTCVCLGIIIDILITYRWLMGKILIVDDDAVILEMLNKMLSDEGHIIFKESSCKNALEITNKENIDLIVTDILMPGKEGLETIPEITEVCPSVPIIAISSDTHYLEMADGLGAVGILTKPINKETLIALVNKHLPNK